MKEFFLLLGGATSLANLLWFAWRIWFRKIEPQSSASWLMWTILQLLILATTIFAGKPMWLPLSYAVGSVAVTLALFARGAWFWSRKETVCAVGVAISACAWLAHGAVLGLVAGVTALNVAGTPLFIDMVRHPARKTFPVWAITALACVFTLLGSDRTFAGTILAWSGFAFNGLLALIVLRGK